MAFLLHPFLQISFPGRSEPRRSSPDFYVTVPHGSRHFADCLRWRWMMHFRGFMLPKVRSTLEKRFRDVWDSSLFQRLSEPPFLTTVARQIWQQKSKPKNQRHPLHRVSESAGCSPVRYGYIKIRLEDRAGLLSPERKLQKGIYIKLTGATTCGPREK